MEAYNPKLDELETVDTNPCNRCPHWQKVGVGEHTGYGDGMSMSSSVGGYFNIYGCVLKAEKRCTPSVAYQTEMKERARVIRKLEQAEDKRRWSEEKKGERGQ